MRIVWLSHLVPYPPAGGALQRAFYLLRHAAREHDVHLLALHQPRLLPASALAHSIDVLADLCASVEVFPLPAERSALHRVATAAGSVWGAAPFDVAWLRSREMDASVQAWSAKPEIDLLHVDTIGLWPYARTWRSSPVVLGHHNVESDLVQRRAQREASSWRAVLLRRDAAKLRFVERGAARRAAVNLVVSELDGARLTEIAPGATVHVVPNGVDTDFWRPSLVPASTNVVAFAGTLGWYPNREAVEFLLADIWPALLATRPDRRLLLIGRDPPAAATRAASRDPRVQVTGFVSDVRPHLQTASVVVCPIRIGGGTRLKVLDALAMEKPVVATAVAVEGLNLVNGTHYLRADTATEFAAQIERLERDPGLRAALGAAGRHHVVSRHDWRIVGQRLDAAFASAIVRSATHTATR